MVRLACLLTRRMSEIAEEARPQFYLLGTWAMYVIAKYLLL